MSWEIMMGACARRRSPSMHQEVDVDADGMSVRLEAGSGYMRVDLDTHIPMTVLVELFRRAGFAVSELPGPAPEEPNG